MLLAWDQILTPRAVLARMRTKKAALANGRSFWVSIPSWQQRQAELCLGEGAIPTLEGSLGTVKISGAIQPLSLEGGKMGRRCWMEMWYIILECMKRLLG